MKNLETIKALEKKYLEKQTELENYPEAKLFFTINNKLSSRYNFERNYSELFKCLAQIKSTNYGIPPDTSITTPAKLEASRLLQNFIDSAKALVEFCTNLYKRYYKENTLLPEYEPKVKEFFSTDPLTNFIHALRNYNTHEAVPPIELMVVQVGFDTFATLCVIQTRRLPINSTYWNTSAKTFITKSGEYIDIFDTVFQYHEKVTGFHDWFHDKQLYIHSKELAQFEEIRKEFNKSRLEYEIDRHIFEDAGLLLCERPLFAIVLSAEELDELEKIHFYGFERANKAIEMIEKRFNLEEMTKMKIRSLYSQPFFCNYKP